MTYVKMPEVVFGPVTVSSTQQHRYENQADAKPDNGRAA
jgi:hypothetical protein